MKGKILQFPAHFLLLPLFFVLHGVLENFGFIPLTDAILLVLTYLFFSVLLLFVFYKIYQQRIKAAIMATTVMAVNFFYGTLKDFFEANVYLHFIAKFHLVVPLLILFALAIALSLNKSSRHVVKVSAFLNLLLLIYIIIDLAMVVGKIITPLENKLKTYSFTEKNRYNKCDSCNKPDIYFLVFDEYASSSSLKRKFRYDNRVLDSFFIKKNFSIQAGSKSNYNATVFSIASILNMSYLNNGHNIPSTINYSNQAYKLIQDNEVIKFLSEQGYSIENYSIFDLAGHPTIITQSFLPFKTKLITDQTLVSRLMKYLRQIVYYSKLIPGDVYVQNNFNHLTIDLVKQSSKQETVGPRFIYAHFEMPHPVFYYDENLKLKSESTLEKEQNKRLPEQYLAYIPYTNAQLMNLVNTILINSNGKAVIVVMGDHGFRYKTDDKFPTHFFENQNAVYFPDKDYHNFYDSISGINQFRVIFNHLLSFVIHAR